MPRSRARGDPPGPGTARLLLLVRDEVGPVEKARALVTALVAADRADLLVRATVLHVLDVVPVRVALAAVPTRAPMIAPRADRVGEVRRPRRIREGHDLAAPHAQRLVQREDLLSAHVPPQVERGALLDELVVLALLLAENRESGRRVLPELLVLEQVPEELAVGVLLGVSNLRQVDRPGDDLPGLVDLEQLPLTVRFGHEAGDLPDD